MDGILRISLAADSQNNLNISFYDSFTEQQVTGDVDYDIQILDKDQSVLWSKTDAIASQGSDTQTVRLPSNGIYQITIKVKSITTNGFPDTSRIGTARGNIVIPSTVSEQQDTLTQSSSQPTNVTLANNTMQQMSNMTTTSTSSNTTTSNMTSTNNTMTDNATVPEFGPVASIVLAMAVLSVVVFTVKTRILRH